jgi:hypothetical protein
VPQRGAKRLLGMLGVSEVLHLGVIAKPSKARWFPLNEAEPNNSGANGFPN